MADPKPENTRDGLGFGDLNPVTKPHNQIAYDPSQSSVMGAMRSVLAKQYKVDSLKGIGTLKGIALRIDEGSDNSGNNWLAALPGFEKKPLLEIKVRIPELHSMLPDPSEYGNTSGPHQKIIDMYPSFIAVDEEVSEDKPAPGDIVLVDFGDKENMEQPLYLGKIAEGTTGGGAGGSVPTNKRGIYIRGQKAGGKQAFNNSNGLNRTGPTDCKTPGGFSGGGYPPPGCLGTTGGVFTNPPGGSGGGVLGMLSARADLRAAGTASERAQRMVAKLKIATGTDFSVALIMAFIRVESGGRTPTRNLVRFEPHVFGGYSAYPTAGPRGSGATMYMKGKTKKWQRPDLIAHGEVPYWPRGGPRGTAPFVDGKRANTNRAAFERAYKLDPWAAIRSTSWGAYQVMGGHLLKLYNDNPQKALEGYDKNPLEVSDDMAVAWFKSAMRGRKKKKLDRRFSEAVTMNPPDFVTLAGVYNGPGKKESYGAQIKKWYNKYSSATEVAPNVATSPPQVTETSNANCGQAQPGTIFSPEPLELGSGQPVSNQGTAVSLPGVFAMTIATPSERFNYWKEIVLKAGGTISPEASKPTVLGVRGANVHSGTPVLHNRSYRAAIGKPWYNDFVVVLKNGTASHPLPWNTRPSGPASPKWDAWKKGFGVDVSRPKHGHKDVGMLRPGNFVATYEAPKPGRYGGIRVWRIGDTGKGKGRNSSLGFRDRSGDKHYDAGDVAHAEKYNVKTYSILFHTGVGSAGCQTAHRRTYKKFQEAVGPNSFYYTLVIAGATPALVVSTPPNTIPAATTLRTD